MLTVYTTCQETLPNGVLIHIGESFTQMHRGATLLLVLKTFNKLLRMRLLAKRGGLCEEDRGVSTQKASRVANRLAEKPSLLSSDVGFRCVRDVKK